MQNVFNSVKGTAVGFAGLLTPVLKESKFKETGVVTPQEFVLAGDHLVHTCPTWQWSAGDDYKTKSYLPRSKQYLVTKKVPCARRYKHIESCEIRENIVESEEGNEGWVQTFHLDSPWNEQLAELSENDADLSGPNYSRYDDDDDDDGDAIDMSAFVEHGFIEDDMICEPPPSEIISTSTGGILKTRTYDLHITYDKYYQTPRLWLFGYDEKGGVLDCEKMFEDIGLDYIQKTVTIETHPHIPGFPMISIHPCKHASVMKKLIQMVTEGGKNLEVHMYLIIFLKFVQSVIPTIDYDYTQNINL